MAQLTKLLVVMSSLLTLSACTQTTRGTPAVEGPPRLLVVSSLIGYVEPCGCTVDLHLGGIARIATAVRRERTLGPTAVVVVGPTLFEKKVDAHRVAQEQAKARLLARSLDKIGIDATVLSPNELLYGRSFFDEVMGEKSNLDVTANTNGGDPRIIKIGKLKVGLIGAVEAGQDLPSGRSTTPVEPVIKAARELKSLGAHVIIGLGAMPRAQLRSVSKSVSDVDIWVLGDHPKEETTAAQFTDGYLVEAGDRGRNIGRLVFFNADQSGPLTDPVGDTARKRRRLEGQLRIARIMRSAGGAVVTAKIAKLEADLKRLDTPPTDGKRFEYTLVPIRQALVRTAPINDWVDQYNDSLKALNLAQAGEVKPVPKGTSGYVGREACQDCHDDAVTFWRTTRHANAWKTLENDQKTFDAECVSCHVTGWQAPGGTVLGKVKGLTDVQCEVCHGPGSRHVESGGDTDLIQLKVTESTCTRCHNEHHSPKFNFDKYVRKIVGKGHQMR